MKVTGRCHCGAIAFEAEVDPAKVRLCHCTDCQILGGAPYTSNAPAEPGTFKLTRGKVATYIKTADSGNKREHGFCPTCAARMYSGSVGGEPRQYSLRVGTIDQRAQLPPRQQIWCASAMPWAIVPGVERLEKQS